MADKTVAFLHWCIICAALLPKKHPKKQKMCGHIPITAADFVHLENEIEEIWKFMKINYQI